MTRTRRPRLTTRVFQLDGDWYLIGRRDDEGLEAVKLTGKDRDLALTMQEENQIELEAALLRRDG